MNDVIASEVSMLAQAAVATPSGPTPRRVKRGWMPLRVTKIVRETHDTDTFFFVDAEDGGRQFDYTAGQYLTFRYDDIGPKPLVRSYTMSSSPRAPDDAAVTVKRVEGGVVSNWMCDHIKEGTVLRARGPIGKFCYDAVVDCPHLFMVAGGSGVTPFVSILRQYADRLGKPGAPQRATLLVSYRSREDLILWKDLQAARQYPGVEVVVTLSRDTAAADFRHGRIDEAMLSDVIAGRYAHSTFMTCGPTAIMDLTTAHLSARGVAPECVKTESFES